MADSISNVRIPSNQWVDLYAETGIAVGTKIFVQNIGSSTCFITESATQPLNVNSSNEIPPKEDGTNFAGCVGAWAYSEAGTSLKVEVSSGFIPFSGEPFATDFYMEVAKGNVPGHSGATVVARNPSASNVLYTDVWGGGGNYEWPTSAEALEVVSDSAEDNPAGTGAFTVLIQTLDINNDPQTEIVTMNGLTPVALSNSVYRMNHLANGSGMLVLTAGTTESNVGKITLRRISDGVVRAVIMPEIGKCEDGLVSVPNGFSVFGQRILIAWPFNESGNVVLTLKARTADAARISTGRVPIYQTPFNLNYEVKNRGTSAIDRAFRARSTNAGTDLIVIIEYILVDDNYIG